MRFERPRNTSVQWAAAGMPDLHDHEVATLLGIGRNAAYEGARRGAFPTIKIGKSVRAPKALIDRMLGIGGEAA
jgi:predicted DNA-binding transcriptional regulator AlpA